MKILIAASEVFPLAKTGGLADVAGTLPQALAALGHDVRVVMPRHRCVSAERYPMRTQMPDLEVFLGEQSFSCQVLRTDLPGSDVPVYLVQCDPLFDRAGLYGEDGADYPDNAQRFALFSLATIWMLKGIDWSPDIIQANDWQTGLIPTYLKTWPILSADPFFNRIRVLCTIHNMAYQGLAEPSVLPEIGLDWSLFTPEGLEFFDQVNLLKGSIVHADHISTVSPTYAEEIQREPLGCGLSGTLRERGDCVSGILNGIDTAAWNPATDPLLPAPFSVSDLSGKAACKAALQRRCGFPERSDAPLLGMISRLAEQKGFDLIEQVFDDLIGLDVQMVFLGTGDPRIEQFLAEMARSHGVCVSAHLTFDERLAHEIESGADIFLMPSHHEPCGLNQLYSLRCGTVPVVHRTGGLADTVVNATDATLADATATGFSFAEPCAADFLDAVRRAAALWRGDRAAWNQIVQTGMAQDFSWAASARVYDRLFRRLADG